MLIFGGALVGLRLHRMQNFKRPQPMAFALVR
jgi:hypothetical protein